MDFNEACRRAKFRNARRYIQDRVWRWLRQHEGASVREMSAGLGIAAKAVSNALQGLQKQGLAKCSGIGSHSTWKATGKRPPQDLRGTAPGTLRSLTAPKDWHTSLPLANIARGCPQANDLLLSTIQRQSGAKYARDGAPREIVRIPTLAEMLGCD